MKKTLFFVLSLAAFLPSLAENYFRENTEWISRVIYDMAPGDPLNDTIVYTYNRIQGDTIVDGETVLKFYTGDVITNLVRSEGEKVYFRSFSPNDETWYQLYDFSMEAGDIMECGKVYDYIKCIEIIPDNPKYGFWDTMTVMGFNGKEAPEPTYNNTDVWLRGIGSLASPQNNLPAHMDGGSERLVKVISEGEVILDLEAQANVNLLNENKNNLQYRLIGNNLFFTGEIETVSVYSLDGKKVTGFKTQADEACFTLPGSGIYFISFDCKTIKIILP